MKDFGELKVWQKSHELTLLRYRVTESFPRTSTPARQIHPLLGPAGERTFREWSRKKGMAALVWPFANC
jgi:hypothetical protein